MIIFIFNRPIENVCDVTKISLYLRCHDDANCRGVHIEAFLFSPYFRNRQFQNTRDEHDKRSLAVYAIQQYIGSAWVGCMFILCWVFGDTLK